MADRMRKNEESGMNAETRMGVGVKSAPQPCKEWLSQACSLSALAVSLVLFGVLFGVLSEQASADSGIVEFSAAPSSTRAGSHPDVQINIKWKNRADFPKDPCGCDNPRVIAVHFPTGFIGNPHVIPVCTLIEFNLASCPQGAQVGVATLQFGTVPIYNLETHPDQAGLIGFIAPLLTDPVFFELAGRTSGDYGLDSVTSPILQLLPFNFTNITLWGVPPDPVHNGLRFRTPLTVFGECGFFNQSCTDGTVTGASANVAPAPYLQSPTTCGVPLNAELDIYYYNGASHHGSYPWPATTGCDQLSFNPSITAVPTTTQADTASGIDVDLKVPQTLSPTTPSPSEIRENTVILPPGFSLNSNAADGKVACSDSDTAIGTLGPATCPEFSKVGTLSLDVAALPGPIPGALYLGEPKPGERYRLIIVADGFGTHVKLAGSVHTDPETGQLTTTFELPQDNLQEINMHFFGSERGVFATPSQCGTYPVKSVFVPWDSELPTQTSLSFFTIDSGPNGGPCPNGNRPFAPSLEAGTSNHTAGMHAPFSLRLDRPDGDQSLSGLTIATPPGFAATLKGIPYCPEAAIAALALPDYSGLGEQASPACPAASLIGTAVAGAGAGSRPVHVAGKVYLAGPYKGAPLSIEVVIPAVSGPYDLGNVAVRAAIKVDPVTAQVTTVSDPLPQIVGGIPLRTRSIQVSLDRAGFALNPTNCDPHSVDTTITGSEGATSSPSTHFQVANCAELGFGPKLALELTGGSRRTGHPALKATLTAKPGEANIASTVVTMPHSLFLDNAHIDAPCTRVQYAANACPQRSVIGFAKAESPLLGQAIEGPVYLRASSNKLPDIVADLRGQIGVVLSGRVDSVNARLRTSFESVPDVPVTKFTLSLAGGRKGLLVNSENLCNEAQRAAVRIAGQNGKRVRRSTELKMPCGSTARHKRHARKAPRPPRERRDR